MKIFITGGTTGIGWSLAEYYLKKGFIVGICGRNLNKLPQDYVKYGERLKCYKADVRDREKLSSVIHEFAKGHLDILVANAGISQGEKTSDPNFVASRNILQTNIDGFLNTFEIGFNLMKPKGKGQLVAIASVAGMLGLPGAGAYCGSKAAVLKMCESFNIDFLKFGINVTTIAPGFIDTPLTKKNKHPMPFLMSSEKASIKIAKAIEKKKAIFIFPFQMKCLVFILERMPRIIYRFIMSLKNFAYPNHYE
jgi:short-subunit dehydrogenase